jgi:hypothetical protein
MDVFECLVPNCSGAFKYVSNFRRHLRQVHGGQFACCSCQLRFKRRHGLQVHWRSVHRNDPRYLQRAAPKNTGDISPLAEASPSC